MGLGDNGVEIRLSRTFGLGKLHFSNPAMAHFNLRNRR